MSKECERCGRSFEPYDYENDIANVMLCVRCITTDVFLCPHLASWSTMSPLAKSLWSEEITAMYDGDATDE